MVGEFDISIKLFDINAYSEEEISKINWVINVRAKSTLAGLFSFAKKIF